MKNDIAYIDGSMDLSAASPIEREVNETRTHKLTESQMRNLIYERTIAMLEATAAPATGPMAADTGQTAAPTTPTPIQAGDADDSEIPGKGKEAYNKAKQFRDQDGGAKGFHPQGTDSVK